MDRPTPPSARSCKVERQTHGKDCTRCSEFREMSEFRPNRQGNPAAECRHCDRDRAREWRLANPKRKAENNRRWREENPDAAREWEAANPERVHAMYQRSYSKDREKWAARRAVNSAVRYGRLVKPERCSRCESFTSSNKLHGHHRDYSKPLEVEWLCEDCHLEEHRRA